jgi:hypothetical protein
MSNIFDAVKKYVRMDLSILNNNGKCPTKEDLPEIIKRVLDRLIENPHPFTKEQVLSVELQKVISHFNTSIPTKLGATLVLDGGSSNHKEWLEIADRTNWNFEKRFKEYLSEELDYGPEVVEDINKAADKILSKLENPKKEGIWRRQGLVFGNVQSGKTTNYSSLINKAADAGYKRIIILGGLTKHLRAQTQIAVEEFFVGTKTKTKIQPEEGPVGVGLFTDYNLKVTSITNRDDNGDFRKKTLEGILNANFSSDPMLFVVQKNPTTLANLIKFFDQKNCTEGEDFPLLLIDDECDNGSVNTNKQDKNPTKINNSIRILLSLFKRSAYVAYTATPFANIFITSEPSKIKYTFKGKVLRDEAGDIVWEFNKNIPTQKLEEIEKIFYAKDLFPEDFIINLPSNNNYIGAKKLFNIPDDLDESVETDPLPVVRTFENDLLHGDEKLKKLERDWIPPRHKTTHTFEYDKDPNEMSPTLKYAIKSFFLSIAAKNIRVGKNDHNTMLINITNWKDTQQQVVELVNNEIVDLKAAIKGNFTSIMQEFQELWEKDFERTTTQLNNMLSEGSIDLNQETNFEVYSWEKIKEQLMSNSIEKIEIHKVYGNNKDVLLYGPYKDVGLNVIAIGAIKLSRGLVLKSLTISYFKRPAKQYDTLLQMGRWFGYRPNYFDLCRLMLDESLLERFEKSAWASELLKKDFEIMIGNGGTPRDWGHRVRTFPEADQLIPTSKNKMLSATIYNLSFAGLQKQTTRWNLENDLCKKNILNLEKLIKQLGANKTYKTEKIKKRKYFHLWKDVNSDILKDFLKNYNSPLLIEKNARKNELMEFINKCNQEGKIKNWDIFIKGIDNDNDLYELGGLKINLLERNPFSGRSINVLRENFHYKKVNKKKEFLKKAFLDTTDERLTKYYYLGGIADKDLFDIIEDEELLNRAMNKTIKSWKSKKDSTVAKPSKPSEEFIRNSMHNEKGFFGIYLFDPKKSRDSVLKELYKNQTYPMIGYSINFPGELDVTYQYIVNKQKQLELGISEEDEDMEEEEIA